MELDSSTPDKFSRHLIIRAPGHAFADNIAVGAFVAALLAKTAAAENLYVLAKPPGAGGGAGDGGGGGGPPATTCIVDKGVYTKNRHFRLPWCCKGGKSAQLEPTGRFAMSAEAR